MMELLDERLNRLRQLAAQCRAQAHGQMEPDVQGTLLRMAETYEEEIERIGRITSEPPNRLDAS